jgi:hypothetical protein
MERKSQALPKTQPAKRPRSNNPVDAGDSDNDVQHSAVTASNASSKTQYVSSMFSSTIAIVAGSGDNESAPMRISESTAREVPFFDKCLDGRFIEAAQKLINLPTDEPAVVDGFLRLLVHTTELSSLRVFQVNSLQCLPGIETLLQMELFLVKIYILADKLGAEKQQNFVISIIRYLWSTTEVLVASKETRRNKALQYAPSLEALELLYQEGLEDAKIFKMFLKQMVHCIDELPGATCDATRLWPKFNEWTEDGGPIVRRLMDTLIQKSPRRNLALDRTFDERMDAMKLAILCRWHVHDTTRPCCGVVE